MVSDALRGVFRSLRIYHGPNAPRGAMDDLYRRFVKPGDLVFDIGAHVGDRVSSFRRLGARVVAVEPQPRLARTLHIIHGADADVQIVAAAVTAKPGEIELRINTANPTVSTVSDAFIQDASGAKGWEGQAWDRTILVPATTLGNLIAEFGTPAFIKIDVEGAEDEVLRGLPLPVAALSFELTTIARDVALRALERLTALGPYGFDLALGESQCLTFGRWVDARTLAEHISALPHDANSGDIYAFLPKTG